MIENCVAVVLFTLHLMSFLTLIYIEGIWSLMEAQQGFLTA